VPSVRMCNADIVPDVPLSAGPEPPRPGWGWMTGMSVFWLADDEVTYLALPLLLARVPMVERATVERLGAKAVRAMTSGEFDTVVLPFGLCADVLRQVAPGEIRAKVLAYLNEEDARNAGSLVRERTVDGYLLRQDITVAGLSVILERLVRGDPPVIAEPSARREAVAEPPRTHGAEKLTQREHAVLALLLKGLSNHQIASSMVISVHGVKRHVSNLLIKFNCSNRTEAALTAARLGIASFPPKSAKRS
jgi:DNA-binding NarL/FixJ family response regulator